MQSSMTMYFKHRPTGMLGRYVESFWYRPATAHDADTGMLILPSGRADIVISLDGAAQAGWTALDRGGIRRDLHYATVRLPNCAPVAAALSGGGAAFGVSFKPHGLRHFSRVPLPTWNPTSRHSRRCGAREPRSLSGDWPRRRQRSPSLP